MKYQTLCALAVTAIALAISGPCFAQVNETNFMQQVRADTEADRQAVMSDNMGLTEEEAKAFWPVYREYRNEMAKVGDRLQALIQGFAEIYDSVTEEQAESMTDEMLDIQHDQLKVRKAYVSKLRKILSQVKVARFVQIEAKLDTMVRQEVQEGIPLVGVSEP